MQRWFSWWTGKHHLGCKRPEPARQTGRYWESTPRSPYRLLSHHTRSKLHAAMYPPFLLLPCEQFVQGSIVHPEWRFGHVERFNGFYLKPPSNQTRCGAKMGLATRITYDSHNRNPSHSLPMVVRSFSQRMESELVCGPYNPSPSRLSDNSRRWRKFEH